MKLKFLSPHNWGIVKVFRDFDNYFDWIRTIKRERANPDSKFNKWKLEHNYFYNVYTTVSLDEADAQVTENIQRIKVIDILGPVHRYLDEELGFAECLTPEFNQYVDDRGKPTLTYLVMYRFVFSKFSWNWLFRWIVIIGITWFVIARYSLLVKLWSLI